MNIENFFKNNPEVKKWMKWGGGVVVTIWIVREIFMMTIFNSMFHWVAGGIDSQEAQLKSMSQRADNHFDSMAKGEESITNDMHRGMDEMDQKFNKFMDDWNKSYEVIDSLKHASEHMAQFRKKADDIMQKTIEREDREFDQEAKRMWDGVEKEMRSREIERIAQDKKADRASWEAARKRNPSLPDYEHHLNPNTNAG